MLDLDRAGLVVMEQVTDVGQTHLGHQVHGVGRVGQRRRQPAVELLAGVLFDGVNRVLDDGALFGLCHAHQVTRVVGAVRVKLPAVVGAGLDDFGVVFAHRHIERDAAAHIATLHGFEHAPETRPVAVVAVGVIEHVGRRPGPGRTGRVAGRVELVELHIGCYPEGHPGPVGPLDHRALRVVGQVVVKRGVAFQDAAPAAEGTRRSCSMVSATVSTSAYLRPMS